MIGNSRLRLVAFATVVLCGAAVTQMQVLRAAEPLRVRMRFRTDFVGQTVKVGDVAEVSGGTAAQRRKLANLDLESLTQRTQTLEVSRRRVHLRCLLAGIRRDELSVVGPSQCRVRATFIAAPKPTPQEEPRRLKPVDPDKAAVQAIREVLAERWRVPQSDISLHLTQPIPGLLKFARGPEPISIRAYPPANLQPGTIKLKIIARLVSGRVLTSTAEVAAGYGKSKPNAIHQVSGRVVTPRNHTMPTPPTQRGPIVVRPRDTVRLVAQKGRLRVALAQAEVLKPARVGEMVELKNPKSRKKISARLVSASQAVIDLSNTPTNP